MKILSEGDFGGTQYCNTVRKKWQIPKYRVENRLNTDIHLARLIISGIYAPDVHAF